MNKLLHERLRMWAESNEGLPVAEAISDMNAVGTAGLFRMMADDIERYYIPRQRDNNGIPYHIGETVYSVDPETEYIAEIIDINETGIIRIRWEDESTDYVDKSDIQHEPPQPKVLDAEGKEIKAGENRFSTRTGEYLAINGVGTEYCLCTVLGNGCTLGTCSYKPSELSSKEPDSLTKLRDDMELSEREYCAKYEVPTKQAHCLVRALAMLERGA